MQENEKKLTLEEKEGFEGNSVYRDKRPNKSTTSSQTEICILYHADDLCAEYFVNERTFQFISPFIYSGGGRDAVLTNFLPVVYLVECLSSFSIPCILLLS